MKRIRMVLIGLVAALVLGVSGASSASAGTVDMHINLRLAGIPYIDCDATFVTTAGPPPAATVMVGSTMFGPCAADFGVSNSPVVNFSSGAVWTAGMNRLEMIDIATGCSFAVTNMALYGNANVSDPYSGTRIALTFCGSANLTITDMKFYP